jgi:hypothetical protein
MKKLALTAGAVLALSVLTAPAAFAAEPADCGSATAALTTAQNEHRDAVADDEKAEKAKDADRDFDRADRELRDAQRRLERAEDAIANPDPGGVDGTAEERRELDSAQKAVRQATDERDRARKQADKENADQLQRKADRTDADELKKAVDEAQDDVNRLCGGVTTTPPADDDPADVDCDEVGASEAQRILDADRSDPNDLDADGDGVACEVDEILPDTDNDGVTINNNVATPSGGVATGGGPAWAFQ